MLARKEITSLHAQKEVTVTEIRKGDELLDVDAYVAATTRHFKKNGDPHRRDAAEAWVREYATEVLPGLMIDRRDPVVLEAQGEWDQ